MFILRKTKQLVHRDDPNGWPRIIRLTHGTTQLDLNIRCMTNVGYDIHGKKFVLNYKLINSVDVGVFDSVLTIYHTYAIVSKDCEWEGFVCGPTRDTYSVFSPEGDRASAYKTIDHLEFIKRSL